MTTAYKLLPDVFKGERKPISAEVDSTPGVEQDVINTAVAAGKTWRLFAVNFDHRFFSSWRLLYDGSLIASGQTGSAHPKDQFLWLAGRDALAGKPLVLKAVVNPDLPIDKIRAFVELMEF